MGESNMPGRQICNPTRSKMQPRSIHSTSKTVSCEAASQLRWALEAGRITATVLAAIVICVLMAAPAMAQNQPNYSQGELERMVSRIALYPDPLLAQTLAAATYPDQIPEAARWADQHHYLSSEGLADAISS